MTKKKSKTDSRQSFERNRKLSIVDDFRFHTGTVASGGDGG